MPKYTIYKSKRKAACKSLKNMSKRAGSPTKIVKRERKTDVSSDDEIKHKKMNRNKQKVDIEANRNESIEQVSKNESIEQVSKNESIEQVSKNESIEQVNKIVETEKKNNTHKNIIENVNVENLSQEQIKFIEIFQETANNLNIPLSSVILKQVNAFFVAVLAKLDFLNDHMMVIYTYSFLYRNTKGFNKSNVPKKIKKEMFNKALNEIDEWKKSVVDEKYEYVDAVETDVVCNLYSIVND